MKKSYLLIFLIAILSLSKSFAQGRLEWSSISSHVNSQITDARGFAVDRSGNNYSVNFTQSAISFYVTYVFYAHDAGGAKLWEYVNDSCFTDCNDKYFNIVPIENDGAIFIGFYDDITGTQVRIKRIDGSGALLWEQYWLAPFLSATPVSSFLDNSGYLIVGFSAIVDSSGMEDFAIAKFDTVNGYLDWHVELPDDGLAPNPLSEVISSLNVDVNNNIYGVGTGSNGTAGIVKNYFFRVDSSGVLDYRRESSYSGFNSSITSIAVDDIGDFYTFGYTGTRTRIEKRNVLGGSLVWAADISRDSALLSNINFALLDNSVFVANNYTYFNPDTSFAGGFWSNHHYMLTKLDTSGIVQWEKDYFTDTDSLATQDGYGGAVEFSTCDNGLYFLSAQHLDDTKNILILHNTDTSGHTIWYDTASVRNEPGYFGFDNNCDVYLSRTFDNYNLTEKYVTGPANKIQTVPENNLFEAFPNPTHSELLIRLKDDKIKNASVLIYNSIGEIVKKESILTEEKKISLSEFPNGIYIIQMISGGNNSSIKKIVKN